MYNMTKKLIILFIISKGPIISNLSESLGPARFRTGILYFR